MRIALAGDVMLGRLVDERLRREAPDYPWGDVLPLLAQADLRIANLECVLADDGPPWPRKTFHFRSDPGNVAVLEAAGIDVVTLANNHVLDHGAGALGQMLAVLDAHGIARTGAGPDAAAASAPAVVDVGGTAVGVVAATDNERRWAAGPDAPGIAWLPIDLQDPRAQEFLALVRRTRARTGFLVAAVHWGPNWGDDVPEEHRVFAHALVEAGADVVVGHSPHVFRGVELHRGRPVLYSAGDFVDDYAVHPVERNDQSFLFHLDVEGGRVRALRLHPTVVEDCRVVRAGREARAIAARMAERSAALGTASRWLADERCLEIPVG